MPSRLYRFLQPGSLTALLLTEGSSLAPGALSTRLHSAGLTPAVLLILNGIDPGPVQADGVLTHQVEAGHGVPDLLPVLVVKHA